MSSSKTSNSVLACFDAKTQALIAHKGYEVSVKLGQGAYGVVFKALHKRTKLVTAVKVLNLLDMSEHSRDKFLPRELQTLIQSRHEHLIQVYDIFRANNRMFIFMEYAANGDIAGYAKRNKSIQEQLACVWFWQTSSGLSYLHEDLHTAHRDIKLENVLLGEKMVAKLSDFGFAKQAYDTRKECVILSTTFCGTKPYECPQIVEHKPYDAFKADIWSMGVSLFIMLHNRFPYHHRDRKQFIAEMWDYPAYLRSRYVVTTLPSGANKLIENMLNPDEEDRASVDALVSNSYLKKNLPK